MMEKWDGTTRAFHIIKTLSSERRNNPALQWGGLWPKIVEKDLYVFVRKYRDACALIVLNKGPERTIDAVETNLPNGIHQCLLTGDKIESKHGKVNQLHVGEGEARVFSFIGKLVIGQAVVRLQVNGINTQPGDRIIVIGDCPELGCWDISKGIDLEYVNPNTWFGELVFNESCGQSIAYKLAVLHPQPNSAPGRENRPVRRRLIPEKGITKWRDVWEE